MMISWIFFLAVVAVTIWYFNQEIIRKLLWEQEDEDPVDILRKRFAKGEIDKEEYEERKAALEDK